MAEGTAIATVPTGTKFVATYKELPAAMVFSNHGLRLVLLQAPCGAPYWLHSDGFKEFING